MDRGVAMSNFAGHRPANVSFPAILKNLLRWAEEVSGRPSGAEGARAIGSSLFFRSAPRPLLRRRGRISGHARAGSLHAQARRRRCRVGEPKPRPIAGGGHEQLALQVRSLQHWSQCADAAPVCSVVRAAPVSQHSRRSSGGAAFCEARRPAGVRLPGIDEARRHKPHSSPRFGWHRGRSSSGFCGQKRKALRALPVSPVRLGKA
jgi:hypothetical protein